MGFSRHPRMSGTLATLRSEEGHPFGAYVALPATGCGPGLLLCDAAGVDAHVRRLADTYAEEGYVVLVPDLSARLPAVEPGARHSTPASAPPADARFDEFGGMRDLAAAVAALRGQRAFRGKVGIVAFAAAGRLALRAAADRLVDCAVIYDGTGCEDALDALGCGMPTVLHVAGDDPLNTPGSLATIGEALAANRDTELYVYPGARRGFAMPGRETHDAPAAGMAYTRTLALLRRVLGPHHDLSALWEAHRSCEFVSRDADATMRTMVAQPYVNHVPTMTGGFGQAELHRFYRDHFIPGNPADMRSIPISRTVGVDRIVNECILCFTHDREIEWMLPGVAPTGRYVEVALVGIVTFRGDKLVHEHIYWDQASVLVQIGLLDPSGLPVAGVESARKVLHPELPSNGLMRHWTRDSRVRGADGK